ncbi:MAG: outer membrane beta-barrel protein [Salibacteraceae bacterium]
MSRFRLPSFLLFFVLLLCCSLSWQLQAQDSYQPSPEDSTANTALEENVSALRIIRPANLDLRLSGYVDAYYARSSEEDNSPVNLWPAVGGRTATTALNIAQLTASINSERVRGIMTVQFGDLPEFTFPSRYQFLQEAYAGVRLHSQLWFDAGIFAPHIGVESLLPKDNHLSTLALPTYSEPFVQAGGRLNWTPNTRWFVGLHLLNGFGVVESPNKNISPGLELRYHTNNTWQMGYNNQLAQRTTHQTLFYQNVWATYTRNRIELKASASYGNETNAKIDAPSQNGTIFSALTSVQYKWKPTWKLAARIEYFDDKNGLLSTGFLSPDGLSVSGPEMLGGSFGITYLPYTQCYFRLETRYLNSLNPTVEPFGNSWFNENDRSARNRTEVLATLGVKFGRS